MRHAPEPRSPLGALGPGEIEQALSDPAYATALLAELDQAAHAQDRAGHTDPRHRMLAVSIRLAMQIYLDHLQRAGLPSRSSQEFAP